MKTKERELIEVEHPLRTNRQMVLKTAIDVESDGGGYENLLLGIHQLVSINFRWDYNPLPHLRVYFPDFSWKYYNIGREIPTLGRQWVHDAKCVVTPILKSTHYIWFPLDDSQWMFTATRMDFWCGRLPSLVGWSAPWFANPACSPNLRSLIGEVFITDFNFSEIGKWVQSPH